MLRVHLLHTLISYQHIVHICEVWQPWEQWYLKHWCWDSSVKQWSVLCALCFLVGWLVTTSESALSFWPWRLSPGALCPTRSTGALRSPADTKWPHLAGMSVPGKSDGLMSSGSEWVVIHSLAQYVQSVDFPKVKSSWMCLGLSQYKEIPGS